MDRGFIYKAVRERKITIFLSIIIIIFGFYSYYVTPKQENPDISAPIAMLTTVYPGASSEEVENLVTSKIEDEATGIEGYDYTESYSQRGLSVVMVFLEIDADTEDAWTELRRNIDDIQSDLPDECRETSVDTDLAETAGMIVSLSGENYTYEQLASFAENFKGELARTDGVSRFEIDGDLETEIKVDVNTAELNRYGFSLQDIYDTIQAQNLEIPSGAVENEESKISVKIPGSYSSLKDVKDTVVDVSKETGAMVRLKDVADVYWGLEDSAYKVKHNGQNAVLLTGYFKDDKNIVHVGRDVQEKLDNLKNELPEDVQVSNVLYQPDDISDRVSNFTNSLLVGMALVILVVCIGMGFRNAVVASIGIPMSILITFIIMYLFGIKVHQISVSALIIALGILVDNAIVVSDAIQVHVDKNEDKMSACLKGARETLIPILTSTLTTVIAFSPLLLVPGVAGDYLETIPQLVIISLVASFGVAIIVIPAVAYMLFGPVTKGGDRLKHLRGPFNRLLEMGLRRKAVTVLIALAVFGVSVYLVSLLGLQFFPKADKDMIYVDINTEKAADLEETEELAAKVGDILEQEEEVLSYTTAIGGGLPKFFITLPPSLPADDRAQVKMSVDPDKNDRFDGNTELVSYLQNKVDRVISKGTVSVKELEQAEPREAPVQIRVTGEDLQRVEDKAREIQALLDEIPGTVNSDNDAGDMKYQFLVDVDADTAMNMGITNYDIQRQVNIALKGDTASVFRQGGNEYDIVVSSDITTKEELENLGVKSSITGNKVLLKQVADIKLDAQRPIIKRHEGERAVTVTCDVKPGYSPVEVENIVEKKMKDLDLSMVNIVFDGEREQINENFGNLGIIALLALGLIYITLLFQFKSFVQPLIILLTVPLSLIGSGLGLLVFKQPLSFTALLGIVSLMGLVVKNAILLIEHINFARERGETTGAACTEAMNRRLRPIILTAVTTISGLIPLSLSGSPLFVPMSVSLMGGLLLSTLLTLVVIPVVYSIVYRS